MRLKNYTNFSDDKIRQIIRFVKPNGLPTSNFDVEVVNRSRFSGNFYASINELIGMETKSTKTMALPQRPVVVVRVSKKENDFPLFTHDSQPTGGYIKTLMLSREEALVQVLAHEFRHFWRYHHPRKREKFWGTRGIASERDADAYAIRKMRQWRRQHNNICVGLRSWP